MNGADLLQIRFGSGTGLDAQVFYVRKQVLQDFSFEQLCHSVHELLGNPLEQFFGPDPILELQASCVGSFVMLGVLLVSLLDLDSHLLLYVL